IVIGDGAVIVLQRLIGVAAVGAEVCISGAQLDRLIIVGDRAGVIAIGGEMQAAIIEIFGLGRIDPHRGGVVVQRAVGAADLAVGRAAVGVGLGVVGIEADRLVVIGDRVLVLALEIPGGAAVGPGQREIRFQPDRLVIILDGAVVFFGVVEGIAAAFIAIGIVGFELDGFVERLVGGVVGAAAAKDFTAGTERPRATGVLGDDIGDLGQPLVDLAAAGEREAVGDHGVETVGLRRCRIGDHRRAAFDQFCRRRLGKRYAGNWRVGGSLSVGGGSQHNGEDCRRGKSRNR